MKRTPFKKKRKKSSKEKAWKIFSEFIRKRDADENGMVKCISCSTVKHWKEMQAGHFIPKSLGLSIYFEERNVHAQCATCNLAWQGNTHAYALALKEKYGEEIVEDLKYQQRQIIKIHPWQYAELVEKYRGEE